MDKNTTMQQVDANELTAIEGGVQVGIYTGDVSKTLALQKNGASVGPPQIGGRDSYFPSPNGGRGDSYGNPDYQEGKITP